MELTRLSGNQAAASGRDAQLDPKLVTAAHQFEASLMQELLKPLNAGPLFAEGPEGADGAGSLTAAPEGSANALLGFGSEALAKALSDKGGLGIARRVLDHFEASAGKPGRAGQQGAKFPGEKAASVLK